MFGGHWRIRLGRGRRGREPSVTGRLLGRLLGTLFFGLFLGLGLFFVALIVRETWRDAETVAWTERRCEITRSEVVRTGGEDPYRPTVAYRTVGGGPEVAGTRIQRRELAYGSYGAALARLAEYPVGSTASCYVSAGGEAVLERGPLWTALWVLLPLVFVVIGGAGLAASWWPARRDRFGRPVSDAIGDGARRSRPGRGMVAGAAVLGLFGMVALWFFAIVPFANVWSARSWRPATCTVEHSSVVSHEGDDGTTYSVDILYRWDRGRGVERSSRHGFFGGSSSGYDGKAEIVGAHPVGAEVGCWVHPERTNEAVLERGLTVHAWLALLPAALLGGAVALGVAGRRRLVRRARMRGQAAAGRSPFAPDDPVLEVLPGFELQPGPVALEAQSSRWGRLLGLIAMTLFWNGIVSVFLHQAWQGWMRGRPDGFLTLFLVPFVLVGLGFVFGTFHALLALGNPRPRLLISASAPRLAESAELQWRFVGAIRRLASVRIVLKGREEATYRVGTDTRTASEDFFEQVLVQTSAPVSAAGGHAALTLPADSMHSFESAHNKIVWQLEVRGEVHRWPDVSETYPLVVLPRATEDAKREGR